MSYQPRSTNPYIMEKKLNECVGGGGFDPSVLEEIESEISVLGSENATMAQDIIDIKGSLNSINDNLKAHAFGDTVNISNPTTNYTAENDGYYTATLPSDASVNDYIAIYVNDYPLIQFFGKGSGFVSMYSVYVKKGMKCKVATSNNSLDVKFKPII